MYTRTLYDPSGVNRQIAKDYRNVVFRVFQTLLVPVFKKKIRVNLSASISSVLSSCIVSVRPVQNFKN